MISRRVGGGGVAGCAAAGAAAAGGGAAWRRRRLAAGERDVAQDLGRERGHDAGVKELSSVHDVLVLI